MLKILLIKYQVFNLWCCKCGCKTKWAQTGPFLSWSYTASYNENTDYSHNTNWLSLSLCPPPPRRCGPTRAMASSFTRFLDHTRRTTVGRTPLTSDQLVAETSTWQHSQRTNIHASGGIRTHNLNRRAAAGLRLRPRGQWDGQYRLTRRANSKLAFFQYFRG